MNLAGLTGEGLLQHWSEIEPLISEAMVKTGADADIDTSDILEWCKSGAMQCWVAHEDGEIVAAAVTEILVYPKRKVLGIPYLGARKQTIRGWKKFDKVLREFAKENDCSAWRGGGREGWVKLFRPDRQWVQFEINVR